MKKLSLLLLVGLLISLSYQTEAQRITRDELIYLTSEWKGERFPDGRPKVSDELIERARKIDFADAWQVLYTAGYTTQFDGGYKFVHDNMRITGRVVTATFLPTRPDLEKSIKERGWNEGFTGNTNAWPIQLLEKGDVYVASCFGKIDAGTMIGSNLGTTIFSKTGEGVIFDAAARDVDDMTTVGDGRFNVAVREFHPSFLRDVVLTGLNTPTRIGIAIAMPGDIVITDRSGVLFIPAHMAQEVIETSEFIAVRDVFSKYVLSRGIYTAGQIDSEWTPAIREHFERFIRENPQLPQLTKAEIDRFMERRTW